MKDFGQKSKLFHYFLDQGCFPQAEVDVAPRAGVSVSRKLMTDIDVLVLRPHPDLIYEKILCDCKSGNRVPPIERVLWLRGLMDYGGAQRGFVLIKKPVEPDHKQAASELGITILSEDEFTIYAQSVRTNVRGADKATISLQDVQDLYLGIIRYPRLKPLLDYLRSEVWHLDGFDERLRLTLGELKTVKGELDPSNPIHQGLFLEACAAFSIGLAECCASLFKSYLHPSEGRVMENALRWLVWGGKARAGLYAKIRDLAIKNPAPDNRTPHLEFPEWGAFERLVREAIEKPQEVFYVPWILRHAACAISKGQPMLPGCDKHSEVAVKLAFEVAEYVIKASQLPADFKDSVGMPLAERLVELNRPLPPSTLSPPRR